MAKRRRVRLTPQQVERWVTSNFPDCKRRAKGKQLAINNPFDGDTGRHLWISVRETTTKSHDTPNYYVHDWRSTRYNMSFLSFVKQYRKVSFFEALREVTGQDKKSLRNFLRSSRREPVEDEQPPEQEEMEKEIELPPLSQPFDGPETRVGQVALNYLANREISKARAIEMQLHYTPGSIVFPYIEYGVLVYWQEREMLSKIFNFPSEEKTGLAKTDYLYNFDNVEQPDGVVIVVESLINSINVGDGCVATGGATISDESKQVDKLRALAPKMIILAPDFDKAGVDSLLDNFMILRKRITCAYGYTLSPLGLKTDWNDVEKKHGVGSARRYIVGNSMRLDIKTAIELRLWC